MQNLDLKPTSLPNSLTTSIISSCHERASSDQAVLLIEHMQAHIIEQNCSSMVEVGYETVGQLEAINKTLKTADGNALIVALLVGVVSAFAGAFAAFLFSFMQWKISLKKESLNAGANEMLSIVADLESVATRYWLSSAAEIGDPESHATELKIKNLLKLLARYSGGLKKLPAKPNIRDVACRVDRLVSDVFELATGGGFESPSRVAEKDVASAIAGRCMEIRGSLYKIIHF